MKYKIFTVFLIFFLSINCGSDKEKASKIDSIKYVQMQNVDTAAINGSILAYLKKEGYDLVYMRELNINQDSIINQFGLAYDFSTDTIVFRRSIGKNILRRSIFKVLFKNRSIAWIHSWIIVDKSHSDSVYSMLDAAGIREYDDYRWMYYPYCFGDRILLCQAYDNEMIKERKMFYSLIYALEKLSKQKK